MRVPPAEFLALDLDVHALLKDVPLRDVSVVDLPDGGDDRTIADVRRLLEAARRRPPVAVRVLVGLRRALGRLFRWDGEPPVPAYASRLSDAFMDAHPAVPRKDVIGQRVQLALQYWDTQWARVQQTLAEDIPMALRRRPGGYRLYWAIYVENVSAFTPLYMAAIEPFRRFVVYPMTLASIRAAWVSLPPRRAAGA